MTNIAIAMVYITMFNGKTHEITMAISHSYVSHYLGVMMEIYQHINDALMDIATMNHRTMDASLRIIQQQLIKNYT